MKTLKENLKTVATYASTDTVNAENFPAWTPSDAALLEQLAMTGTLGNWGTRCLRTFLLKRNSSLIISPM